MKGTLPPAAGTSGTGEVLLRGLGADPTPQRHPADPSPRVGEGWRADARRGEGRVSRWTEVPTEGGSRRHEVRLRGLGRCLRQQQTHDRWGCQRHTEIEMPMKGTLSRLGAAHAATKFPLGTGAPLNLFSPFVLCASCSVPAISRRSLRPCVSEATPPPLAHSIPLRPRRPYVSLAPGTERGR